LIAKTLTIVAVCLLLAQAMAGNEGGSNQTVIEGRLVDSVCHARGLHAGNDHGQIRDCGRTCALDEMPVGIVDDAGEFHLLGVRPSRWAHLVGARLRLRGSIGKHGDVFFPAAMTVQKGDEWVRSEVPVATFHGVPLMSPSEAPQLPADAR
jgi:hypothetical protein